MKRNTIFVLAMSLVATLFFPVSSYAATYATTRPNVVILMSDDQRWDKVTPLYTPRIWDQLVDTPSAAHPNSDSIAFAQSFVTNPLCCPSRTTVLSGKYSHTTGVWTNDGTYGGFGAFDDTHTISVDFQQQGYRTAMIGKYLNGYVGGSNTYVPPGWTRWFATNTSAFYDYGVTAKSGNNPSKLLNYGNAPTDYITRVLDTQASNFATNAEVDGVPFFMYYAFTAPHGPAIPDPRDIGRFSGEDDFSYSSNRPSSSLESAYGIDRAVGHLLSILPDNTIVFYMSDNGYMWGEPESNRGLMVGKKWPYNPSVRVPMIWTSLDGTIMPNAGVNDIVSNVDLRTTLLHAAGLVPLTDQEGINWMDSGYTSRSSLLIEHYESTAPTYCGVRTVNYMYARFLNPDGTYTEEMFAENPVNESDNLVTDPPNNLQLQMRALAEGLCNPAPPGYSWAP